MTDAESLQRLRGGAGCEQRDVGAQLRRSEIRADHALAIDQCALDVDVRKKPRARLHCRGSQHLVYGQSRDARALAAHVDELPVRRIDAHAIEHPAAPKYVLSQP